MVILFRLQRGNILSWVPDTCIQARVEPPDSKVHGANMGPIWGRQDPGGPHVGPMNFAIWVCLQMNTK